MSESLRVVDSHVHFWNPSALSYPWLANLPALNREYSIADYRSSTRVDDSASTAPDVTNGVIFVEANCKPEQSAREVEIVDALANLDNKIVGIVAFVDMLDVGTREAELANLKRMKRVVGVRHNIQGNGVGYCTQTEFVNGVSQVGELGLIFDLCATANQLDDVCELISKCEHAQFVLDHCGKPDIASGEFSSWARSIERLSQFSNVTCKISGLLTQALEHQRTTEQLLKYAAYAVKCFGHERIMYGSDWPVLTLSSATEYTWRKVAHGLSDNWSLQQRQAFFADNAVRIYNLPKTT